MSSIDKRTAMYVIPLEDEDEVEKPEEKVTEIEFEPGPSQQVAECGLKEEEGAVEGEDEPEEGWTAES